MKKTFAVLAIYEKLLLKQSFNAFDVAKEFNCSERTVLRYISDIKDFLSANHADLKIHYSQANKTFEIRKVSKTEND